MAAIDNVTLALVKSFTNKAILGHAGAIVGDSAYQVWLNAGNVGSVQDFLESLIGADGSPAIPNYSNMGAAVISENDGEWTSTDDGYIYVETGAQSIDSGWLRLNVFINNVRVAWNLHSSTLDTNHLIRGSVLRPIGNGDTVKVTVHYAEGRIAQDDTFYVVCRFIPNRAIAPRTAGDLSDFQNNSSDPFVRESGLKARQISFDSTDTQLHSENVQDAIVEVSNDILRNATAVNDITSFVYGVGTRVPNTQFWRIIGQIQQDYDYFTTWHETPEPTSPVACTVTINGGMPGTSGRIVRFTYPDSTVINLSDSSGNPIDESGNIVASNSFYPHSRQFVDYDIDADGTVAWFRGEPKGFFSHEDNIRIFNGVNVAILNDRVGTANQMTIGFPSAFAAINDLQLKEMNATKVWNTLDDSIGNLNDFSIVKEQISKKVMELVDTGVLATGFELSGSENTTLNGKWFDMGVNTQFIGSGYTPAGSNWWMHESGQFVLTRQATISSLSTSSPRWSWIITWFTNPGVVTYVHGSSMGYFFEFANWPIDPLFKPANGLTWSFSGLKPENQPMGVVVPIGTNTVWTNFEDHGYELIEVWQREFAFYEEDGDPMFNDKQLATIDDLVPPPPASGTYILQSVDGVMQWVTGISGLTIG